MNGIRHNPHINEMLTESQAHSFVENNDGSSFMDDMGDVAKTISERIRQRMAVKGFQKDAHFAEALGWSAQRLGNYISRTKPRAPGIVDLMRLAKALDTSVDWLAGFSEAEPSIPQEIDIRSAIQRLLENAGMTEENAEVLAEVSQAVLRTLSAVRDDGDAQTRARATADALWLARQQTKPS